MAAVCGYAQESVTFDNIQYWTPSELAPYVGKTIRLTQPWIVNQVSGGGFYGEWMKNPHSAMISCNDGFRPVSFLVEAIDE